MKETSDHLPSSSSRRAASSASRSAFAACSSRRSSAIEKDEMYKIVIRTFTVLAEFSAALLHILDDVVVFFHPRGLPVGASHGGRKPMAAAGKSSRLVKTHTLEVM